MPETETYAFEKDPLPGLILSLLNEDTKTVIGGFETILSQDLTHKNFAVIASNIPFGNFRVFDSEMWKKVGIYEQSIKTIHNYFGNNIELNPNPNKRLPLIDFMRSTN